MDTDKLEKGMYVRYIASFHHNDSDKPVVKIGKIIRVDNYIQLDTFWPSNGVFPTEDFKKFVIGEPSFNILDLIELGDYVDGVDINLKDENGVYHGANDAWDEAHFTDSKDVHDIVTKEQFEAMKYKIGE